MKKLAIALVIGTSLLLVQSVAFAQKSEPLDIGVGGY